MEPEGSSKNERAKRNFQERGPLGRAEIVYLLEQSVPFVSRGAEGAAAYPGTARQRDPATRVGQGQHASPVGLGNFCLN